MFIRHRGGEFVSKKMDNRAESREISLQAVARVAPTNKRGALLRMLASAGPLEQCSALQFMERCAIHPVATGGRATDV